MKNIFRRALRRVFKARQVQPKIVEVNYKWAQPLQFTMKPQMIVYHHTVEIGKTPEEIHQLHVNRGWAGIGYHFYIRKDGTIYRGRPENAVGSHAPGVNNIALGIAFEGNFMVEKPTEQQLNSAIILSKYLVNKYGIKELRRHKDVKPTTECPGINFPFDYIKSKVLGTTTNKTA
ncbi:peptidoglycan recognition family protein [Clostridium manihotivorum]|uniref:N-acetylmuramoyl-L-alanine amidase n=1 Tax=Clostridium manihotivorum TaxID=2320868 RepID=A0A3R5U8I4_9CLOT|nr:peptidoglycan recognition family protein [Clostridium manihotivorum]QAA31829.1 N-acetylmuramoyl-L-alanine amidase [Clostridium manihotivorum]